MPRQLKKKSDPIADGIEDTFHSAHGVVDTLLWPLKPVDSVIHGTARGVTNWLLDEHPNRKTGGNKKPVYDEDDSDDDDGRGGGRSGNTFGSNKGTNIGAGNGNNNNGKINARVGNQKLTSGGDDEEEDDSDDDDSDDDPKPPPPSKGKGGRGGNNNNTFGRNSGTNIGAGNGNNNNGSLDARVGKQTVPLPKKKYYT